MKVMKKIMLCGLIISLSLLASANPGGGVWASGNKVTLSLWAFTDELKIFIERFEEKNSDITVDLTIVPHEDYITKLRPVLWSGKNAPDLFLGEYAHIVDLVESGFWDDLSAAPYNADVSDMYPFTVEVGTDSNGKLRALSWQACVGGFFYRRSLAKKYLGTDDPHKVGKMLSTPSVFLETARMIKYKSDYKVKIIAGYSDYQHYVFASRTKPFVSDEELTVEQPILDYFDLAKTMRDEGLTADIDTWSPPWFDEMNAGESGVFGYILPEWGLKYVLESYAEDTTGDWGLCRGPASFFWGGSWMGIYKDSRHKQAAWEFLRFVTLDRDTLRWYARESGEFVNNKTVVNQIKNEFRSEYLGGQSHFSFFAEEAPKVRASYFGAYELDIRGMLMSEIKYYAEGDKSKEQAVREWKRWVGESFGAFEAQEDFYSDSEKQEGVLSVWSFTDELKKFIYEFERLHPGVRIDLTIVPCEEYLNKIRPLLRSGRNAPDVFTAEYSNVVDLVESGYYDDLGRAPYNADTSDVLPYIVEVGTDSEGGLRALSWQAVPGGIFYRRSVAKQYLGTDDPEKIGRMLSTPEKLLETARKLKQKSGGRVKLIAGYGDYQQIVFAMRKKAFVTHDKLNIEQCVLDYFDFAKILVDEELTAEIGTWSPPWFENMNEPEPEIMCYILPTWGLHYVIKPNARDTMGDWGLCEGPAVYFWGGTWVGIYRDCVQKKLAWEFIKFMTLDRDSQKWWAIETGDFVSNRTVIDRIKRDFADPLLDGQNHYEFYARVVNKVDGSLLKKYDLDIRYFLMGAINNYVGGVLTKEEAIDQFKYDVKNAFPEVRVE
jgi:multiple sugar transport system substrate-binding protein